MHSIVIDCGTSKTRAGFSGSDSPSTIFNTVVGTQKTKANYEKTQYFIGDETLENRDFPLTVKHPVEYGCITNWDYMEKIFHYIFYGKLKVDPEEHFVLLTEDTFSPKCNREKLTMTMFESYNVPGFFLASQAVLSLLSCGRVTGIVAKSGEGCSEVVPIYEGCALRHAGMKLHVSGMDLTHHLRGSLYESGYTSLKYGTVEQIKNTYCYVPQDYEKEMEPFATSDGYKKDNTFTLPDSSTISLESEMCKIGEAIFNPKFINLEYPGLHEILHSSLRKVRSEVVSAKDFSQAILLDGGNTMLPGIKERLESEMLKLDTENLVGYGEDFKVIAPEDRTLSEWKGGSVMASCSSFENCVITKEEYDEFGPMLVHRKCFY